jgi:hypothetical protein
MNARDAIVCLTIALATGCASTRSGPTPRQSEYLKAHPLSPDEERRLYAREVRRGDTLDRVLVTLDGCGFERQHVEGSLSIWRVQVPIDARPIRLDTDKLEEVQPGSSVLLTFDHDLLKSALNLE